MVIFGALCDTLGIIFCGLAGLLLRRFIPGKLADFLMQGLSLVVALVAIQGMSEGGNVIITVLSIVIGGAIGFCIDIDKRLNQLGDFCQRKMDKVFGTSAHLGNISEGFISATLFTCVGAMAILGSLQSGLQLDHTTLIAKAFIDGLTVLIMASTMGIGTILSAVPVFIYEASMSLAASFVAPFLPPEVVTEVVCTGSVLLLGMAFNLLHISDIKAANFIPAVFLPIFICMFM